jgi:hypothetical protein
VALVAISGMCLAQLSSTVTLSNGIEVQVSANLGQPTGQEKLTVEMVRASGNSFYRTFWDQNNLVVFAYELAINRSSDGNEFRFVAKPVGTEFAARFPQADAGKPVPSLSSEHDFRPLHSGDHDEIGLFEIPGMGLTVNDSIRVALDEQRSASTGAFQLSGLKVSINGTPSAGPARVTVSGRYAMFYIPGRGAYFFSTDAPAGRAFVKAGSVDGNRMQFNAENDSYECAANQLILVDSQSGEVWVYHDPSYSPTGNWTRDIRPGEPEPGEDFFTSASDSLNWWLAEASDLAQKPR